MNLNNAIYFIQHLENTGKKRIEFLIHKSWRTIKVIGKNYQSGPRAMSWLCFPVMLCHGRKLSRKAADQCTPIYGWGSC